MKPRFPYARHATPLLLALLLLLGTLLWRVGEGILRGGWVAIGLSVVAVGLWLVVWWRVRNGR